MKDYAVERYTETPASWISRGISEIQRLVIPVPLHEGGRSEPEPTLQPSSRHRGRAFFERKCGPDSAPGSDDRIQPRDLADGDVTMTLAEQLGTSSAK